MEEKRCAKCRKRMALVTRWFQCQKCQTWFCPSCMTRFCYLCKGAVESVAPS